ncbi:hypothetical protein C8R44DRAFT_814431, partial [Mycena epipterygia]
MAIYLSILAGSSTITAPFNKGSRDHLRVRNLSHFAASSFSAAQPRPARWRDYNPGRAAPTNDEITGWRDYCISADGYRTIDPVQPNCMTLAVFCSPHWLIRVSDISPGYRSVQQQLGQYARLISSDSSASPSAASLSILSPAEYQQPMVLDALLLAVRQSKGYGLENLAEHVADTGLRGKVEQATRESWTKSGLRISPFRLQQGLVGR